MKLYRIIFMSIILITITACSSVPQALTPPQESVDIPRNRTLFVNSNGWHTGILIQADQVNQAIPTLAKRFPQAEYYEIGWGDKGFYKAKEVTTLLALNAMFCSDGSLVHVVAYKTCPSKLFKKENLKAIKVSDACLTNTINYVKSSIKFKCRKPIPRGHGLYGDSQFYEGIGTYRFYHTCNNWTAKALYSAGVDLSPSIKWTADSVMNSIEE